MFRNITIQCLTEIGGLQVGPEYNDKFILLFNMVMGSVVNMIPLTTSKDQKIAFFSFFLYRKKIRNH